MSTRLSVADLLPETDYAIQVRAVGDDGRVSDWSLRLLFTTISDAVLPATPQNVTWVVSGDSFHGEWDAVTQNNDGDIIPITRYELELVGSAQSRLVAVPPTTDAKVKFDLDFAQNVALWGTPQATVSMRVRAVDNKELKSAWSSPTLNATNGAPAAPASITGDPLVDAINVSWAKGTDADISSYILQVSTTGVGGTYSTIYTGTNNQFTHSTTQFATDHWYRVYSVDKFGTSSASATTIAAAVRPKSAFTVDAIAPPAPATVTTTTGFDATKQNSYLNIAWTASAASDLAGYDIRWSTDATNWEYRRVNNDVLATRIENVVPGTAYYTAVRASDWTSNNSAWTNAGTYPITTTADTSAPSTPSTPTASVGTQKIQVVHDGLKAAGGAMEADVDYYQVFASTTNGFTTYNSTTMLGTIQNGPAIIETFNIPASSGSGTTETWYVKVRAVDKAGNISPASAQATAAVGLILTANIGDAQITNAKVNDLSASKITAGTISAQTINIGSTGVLNIDSTGIIKSNNWSAGTAGYRLTNTALEINNGSIAAGALNIQTSPNIVPPAYADFEFSPDYYVGKIVSTNTVSTIVSSQKRYNNQSLQVVSNAINSTVYLGANIFTPTEIQIPPLTTVTYIVSFWAMQSAGAAQTIGPRIQLKTASSVVAVNGAANATLTVDGVWRRYTTTFSITSANGATGGAALWFQHTLGTGITYFIDGIQLERQIAAITTASDWTPPGSTSIDGGAIRTGAIRSNTDLTINAITLPTWSIDLAGNAQFGNAFIRGNTIVGFDVAEADLSYIKSYNYNEGATGWIIRSDGVAEFRSVAVGSFPGSALEEGTVGAEVFKSTSILTSEIVVTGSIHTIGEMGEDIGIDYGGFHVLGPYGVPVTNKALSASVATLTTIENHGFTIGNKLVIGGMGAPFDGVYTVETIPSNTTFTFTIPGSPSDVTSVAATGLAQSNSTATNIVRPELITFPTDGTNPNIISGVLSAETLIVNNGATFRGTSAVERGAKIIINAAVVKPTSAPTMTQTYNPTYLVEPVLDYREYLGSPFGICKGHNGNWFVVNNGFPYIRVVEYTQTGQYVGTVKSELKLFQNTESLYMGITYDATNSRYHLLRRNTGGVTSNDRVEFVETFNTSWALQSSYTIQTDVGNNNGWNGSCSGWDHVNNRLIYAFHDGTNLKYLAFGMTAGAPTSTVANNTVTGAGAITFPKFIARVNTLDGSSNDRFIVKQSSYGTSAYTKYFCVFDGATLAHQTNEEWDAANGTTIYGGYYDTTRDRILSLSSPVEVSEYQSGDSNWSGAGNSTAYRHIGYTWYDAVGTTHETDLSSRAKVSLKKRAALKVTIAPIPVGSAGADDPTKARIYVAASTNGTEPVLTNPVSTNWHLRETIDYPATSAIITPDAAPSGGQPPYTGNNGFAALIPDPGQIISSTGNSYWKGDDTAQFYSLILKSGTDVNASAGNRPPLIIGNYIIGGTITTHLRIDGNEIQAMATDSTTGSLFLNNSGGSVKLGANGTGINAINFDTGTFSTGGGNGSFTVTHGLGGTPITAVACIGGTGELAYRCSVTALGSSTFTVVVTNSSTNAAAANGTSIQIRWIAIR